MDALEAQEIGVGDCSARGAVFRKSLSTSPTRAQRRRRMGRRKRSPGLLRRLLLLLLLLLWLVVLVLVIVVMVVVTIVLLLLLLLVIRGLVLRRLLRGPGELQHQVVGLARG